MLAKKCDRCRGFYEEIEPNAIEVFGNSLREMIQGTNKAPTPRLHNDLCEECEKSFKQWWNRKDE